MSKNKPSIFEGSSCKKIRKARDSRKSKKTVQLGQIKDTYINGKFTTPDNISPLHKTGTDQRYRENDIKEPPVLENTDQINEAIVFEGSSSGRWNIFNNEFGYGQKYIFLREKNYSNQDFLNKNLPNRNRRFGYLKSEFSADRSHNISTENGIAADHQFFSSVKTEDNLNEDVHSFIDNHMK